MATNNFNNFLWLRGYNNYFNRKLRREETVDYYKGKAGLNNWAITESHNFNPNDGVNAVVIENTSNNKIIEEADYLVVLNYTSAVIISRWFIIERTRKLNGQYEITLKRDTLADFYNEVIDSPIFVEKAYVDENNPLIFNSEGINFNQIKKSEKELKDITGCPWIVGYIPRADSETESITIAAESENPTSAIPYTDLPWTFQTGRFEKTINTMATYTFHMGGRSGPSMENPLSAKKVITNIINGSNTPGIVAFDGGDSNKASVYCVVTSEGNYNSFFSNRYYANARDSIFTYNALKNILNVSDYPDQYSTNYYLSFNNKLVVKNGSYYRIHINIKSGSSSTRSYTKAEFNTLVRSFSTWVGSNYVNRTDYRSDKEGNNIIEVESIILEISAENVLGNSLTLTVPGAGRKKLKDAPYDMFCIPYGEIAVYPAEIGGEFTTNKGAALQLAMAYAKQVGSANLYDIQLLPYCPCREWVDDDGDGSLHLENAIENSDMVYAVDTGSGSAKKQVMIFCSHSSDSFVAYDAPILSLPRPTHPVEVEIDETLDFESPHLTCSGNGNTVSTIVEVPAVFDRYQLSDVVVDLPTPTPYTNFVTQIWGHGNNSTYISFEFRGTGYQGYIGAYINFTITYQNTEIVNEYNNSYELDLKISNECDFYRFVSPNFNGMYEFNLAKNNGHLTNYTVEYTYKPYSPYIHVIPYFDGLYGQSQYETNKADPRGLICGGDFSLPQTSDAWRNYEVQNKNYQVMFDRQITNLDINNAYQKQNDIIGAITGSIGGAASGAITGAMSGAGPWGAVAGAAIGGAASVAGGIADINRSAKLREENKQYTIDMYNYNLGNVKALPDSLTKVSSFNITNRYFPILEYYTCTDTEKEALKNKIKYTGMTIMTIGKLSEYIGNATYFKGDLIRCDGVKDDSHIIEDIYSELKKGVYL